MSFILDALRKAEASRQGTPERAWAVPHPAPRPATPGIRAWLLPALVLSVATAAMTAVFVRPPAETAAPRTARGQVTKAEPPPATVPERSPAAAGARPEVRLLSAEAQPPAPQPAGAAPVPPMAAAAQPKPGRVEVRDLLAAGEPGASSSAQPSARPEPEADPSDRSVITPSRTPGTVRVETARERTQASEIPRYEDLIVSGVALPALRMDMHVYSSSPDERFVYLNMRRIGEGRRGPDDVLVEEIRQDGAVLSYQGQRFLLTSH